MCVCFVARSKFNLYACVARATGIEFIYIRDRVKFSCHGHTHTRDAYAYITNNACIDYFLFFNFLRVWKYAFAFICGHVIASSSCMHSQFSDGRMPHAHMASVTGMESKERATGWLNRSGDDNDRLVVSLMAVQTNI